jgi:tetratricopeptide (TPR) repeat protein
MTSGVLMPETARILKFPVQGAAPLSPEEVLSRARLYVEGVATDGAEDRRQALLSEPDVLLSVCVFLREQVDGSALQVFQESTALYRRVASSGQCLGTFDENDYFLGETALLAATASRVLGKRGEAELWLDRAEAGFRNTVNPGPLMAGVAYQRLALRCETGRYEEVVELAPMLAVSFAKLKMIREEAKCVFLEGLALKQSSRHEAAVTRFESLRRDDLVARDPGLVGLALVNLADIQVAGGCDELAMSSYSEAVPLLKRANRPAALAHLKGVIGETLRRQGRLVAAIGAYRAAVEDYVALGMSTWVAYLRLVLAQTLLEASQPREAEWQILAALPTIDQEKMVPEGFAAVALLRESVRQRKTDPKALLELREYLQAQN